MEKPVDSNPDFDGVFGDKRIGKRAAQILIKLTTGRSRSLREITEDESEQRSFYRLFSNESFSESGIIKSITARCGDLSSGRHLLCIQDTTEFNFSAKQRRIKPESGLGTTSRNDILGFMLHNSLVADADRSHALGYSFIKTWERPEGTADKQDRNYRGGLVPTDKFYRNEHKMKSGNHGDGSGDKNVVTHARYRRINTSNASLFI
jgi:hypothetical protein